MSDAFQQMMAVLSDEKDALLAGDFAPLDVVAARAEAVLDGLHPGALTLEQLEAIEARVQEVQALTQAASRGVQSARDGLETVERSRRELASYDARGASKTLHAVREGPVRRA